MKLIKKLFWTTLIPLTVSALSPLLVLFSVKEDGSLNVIGYIAGVMFWSGLLLGCLGAIVLKKKWKEKCAEKFMENDSQKRIQIRFFSNLEAKIADSFLLVGIVGVVLSILITSFPDIISALFLCMLLSGVYGHCMFNGTIYKHLKKFMRLSASKRRKENNNDR